MTNGGLSIPNLHVLVGHDSSAMGSRFLPRALAKLALCARFEAFIRALDALSDAGYLPEKEGLYGEVEIRDFAGERYRSL